ncbi:MAG: FliM/FliN family flagellar motor switch protein [Bdellovibrionales bacterium]|nr:FliM/FliN family flagellar motor switch protein [Bdellovibrionales bacterium]
MEQEDNNQELLAAWEPFRYLRQVDDTHAKFSRGFLRCRPEKWFPGFAAQWLPLAHSFGVEIKIIDVHPLLSAPRGLEIGFAGKIDGEPMAILLDHSSARILAETFIPGCGDDIRQVLLEYLARRCLGSLSLSWSGPESSRVEFDGTLDPFSVREVGAVKLGVLANGSSCTVWIVLGSHAVERLDGLWRRQVRSTSRPSGESTDVAIEIAEIAVPPADLVNYMRSGTVIDLEVPVSDTCIVLSDGKPWLTARLCNVEGNLGFEVQAGSAELRPVADGTTKLSVELGRLTFDVVQLSEMAQVGSIFNTHSPLSSEVSLVVNREKVASATLCVFEGRLAVSVK